MLRGGGKRCASRRRLFAPQAKRVIQSALFFHTPQGFTPRASSFFSLRNFFPKNTAGCPLHIRPFVVFLKTAEIHPSTNHKK